MKALKNIQMIIFIFKKLGRFFHCVDMIIMKERLIIFFGF